MALSFVSMVEFVQFDYSYSALLDRKNKTL